MDDAVLDDEEEVETSPRRRGPPRLGSFVTIAVAILMLFGAASRVGKIPETLVLFGIDRQAENRIRQEEDRLRAAITIGAIPVRTEDRRRPPASLPVREGVLPPSRGEFDIEEYRSNGRAPVSMPVRNDAGRRTDEESGAAFPGSIESMYNVSDNYGDVDGEPRPQEPVRRNEPEYYVVAKGDTWVKISQRTLGDAKRWQEIMRANPASQNGLNVGMRLTIPK